MSNKFELKVAQFVEEGLLSDDIARQPSVEEKLLFCESLYRLLPSDLTQVVAKLRSVCPEALRERPASSGSSSGLGVEVRVDAISPAAFHSLQELIVDTLPRPLKKRRRR